jgi:FixJ family two-component response regulator
MSKHAQRIKRADVERQLRLDLDPTPKTSHSRLVAVVDDDPFFRRSLQRLLGTMGFEVRGFGSAEEFLSYPHKKRFRCLLLDFNLPGMTGSELLARLFDLPETLPVIVISGDIKVEWRVAGMARVAAILSKPVDAAVLGSALDASLAALADR